MYCFGLFATYKVVLQILGKETGNYVVTECWWSNKCVIVKKKGEKNRSFCCSIYLLFHLFFQLSFYLSSIYYSLSLSIYLSFYPLSVVLSLCQSFCLPFYYRFSANPVYSKVKKWNLKLFKIPSLVLTSILCIFLYIEGNIINPLFMSISHFL